MIPLFDSNRRDILAPFTMTMILANMTVFAFQLLLARQGQLEALVGEHAFVPARVGQDPLTDNLRTVFTSMFLHGGFTHLIMNLWFLFVFGPPVENRLGTVRTTLLYLGAGAGAAFAQYAVGPEVEIPMIGASGGIAGILGAYLFLFPFAMIVTLVPWIIPLIPIPAFVFMLLWFAFQFMQGMSEIIRTDVTIHIAWWAHIGGFIGGFCLTVFLRPRRRPRK